MKQKHILRATNTNTEEERKRKENIKALKKIRRRRGGPSASIYHFQRTLHRNPGLLLHPQELWQAIPHIMKWPLFWVIFLLTLCYSIVTSVAVPINSAHLSMNRRSDDWFKSSLRGYSPGVSPNFSDRKKGSTAFPYGCVSNQQCIVASTKAMYEGWIDAALPYCWVNGECRGERQVVMQLSGKNVSESSLTPYPVFHQGEEMCVTIMFNPSLVLFDDLWNIPKEEDLGKEEEEMDQVTQQQERLVLFQTLPLRITLERMWMCSSKKKIRALRTESTRNAYKTESIMPDLMNVLTSYGKETEEEKDVVPHTYIRHHDPSEWETGCLTNHPAVRKQLIYNLEDGSTKKKQEGVLSGSASGLSSKICFSAKALGPPDVPCFVDAEVSVRVQRKTQDQDLTPYEAIIRSFGLDPQGKTLPSLFVKKDLEENEASGKGKEKASEKGKKEKGKEEEHEEVCEKHSRNEEVYKKRRHGNREYKIQKEVGKGCAEEKHEEREGSKKKGEITETERRKEKNKMFGVPFTLITVTSADTLTPHPETSRVTRAIDILEGDEDSKKHEEMEQYEPPPRAKTVGYYYYYDPVANGYYYYHPHVHCDWDLTFNQGAGICEVPGRLHSDRTHVFVIVLSTLGIGIGLVFFVMDWKSRVLFVRGT